LGGIALSSGFVGRVELDRGRDKSTSLVCGSRKAINVNRCQVETGRLDKIPGHLTFRNKSHDPSSDLFHYSKALKPAPDHGELTTFKKVSHITIALAICNPNL
jgi:hypothetical protein